MQKPILVDPAKVAENCVSKDIINNWGFFHTLSAEVLNNPIRIKVTCSVVTHKLCSENLIHGTQAMKDRVFILTLKEAKELAKKPNIEKAVKERNRKIAESRYTSIDDGEDIPF